MGEDARKARIQNKPNMEIKLIIPMTKDHHHRRHIR